MVDKKEIKPNFLLVGAPKAGTTSIAAYLDEHPDILISKEKEPFYFLPNILIDTNKKDPMYESIRSRAHLDKLAYYSLFNNYNAEKAIGEATVHYLYHYKEVIPRVLEELGDVKIIIVLRDPSLRAFSNYTYQSRGQLNSFEEALELESYRKEQGYNSFWFYKEVGLYYNPVKAYLENFTNVHVCYFEDFLKNREGFIKEMYNFLEVDTGFLPDVSTNYNPTLVPKNKIFKTLIFVKHKLKLKNLLPQKWKKRIYAGMMTKNSERLNPETHSRLKSFFKTDIQKLERLLNVDLSSWYV